MNEIQEELARKQVRAAEHVVKFFINKAAPTMKDLIVGVIKWLGDQNNKILPGKQSLKQLTKDGSRLASLPLNSDNIKTFESIAKKYGMRYSMEKDSSKDPPQHSVFFATKDADTMTAVFKKYLSNEIKREKSKKPPFKKVLNEAKEKVKNQIRDQNKNRTQEIGGR